MSADITNWLQVNIVNNPQILQSLIALIILTVAIFLFSEKPTEKIPFRRYLSAALFVFAIFVFLHANIADLGDVFIAWATIVLAGVAVFSMEESRRLRKQYKEREERDRKELLLDRIREWAECIRIVGLERDIVPLRISAGDSGHFVLLQTMNTFRTLLRKGQYISGITLTTWPTLHGIVEKMRSELPVLTEAISEYDEDPSDTKFNTADEYRDVVNVTADSIIDEVSRIQTADMD